MGFSITGTFAIVAIGLIVGFGVFQGAAANRLDRVSDARDAAGDDRLTRHNTAINITVATFDENLALDESDDTVAINVTNEGATTLSVNETDVVVDNEYADPNVTEVEGNADTDYWHPGETLHVEIVGSAIPEPDLGLSEDASQRVKIVVGPGISDWKDVRVI